ncbi:MAG: Uma2 family endonuclease [Planctomycetes bacterium]|nr:Uma2 family endonuclease [Planctomycetota bacterium]
MIQKAAGQPPGPIIYPDSDGKPLAENTKQARWIVVLFGNLCALFRDRIDVFVAIDLFWYPVEGQPEIRTAPDVLVVFGRPKGDRSSYKHWEEAGIPLTVVFEILSPTNTYAEMDDKLIFYEEYGVEEYYLYDPDTNRLWVYVRRGEVLRRVRPADGFISPRLKIRFDLSGPEMIVYHPDGRKFLTFGELETARVEAQRQTAEAQRQTAEAQRQTAEAQRQTAEAQQQADEAEQRASLVEQRVARLAELSRKARRGQASPEELQELERLEEQSLPAPPS